MDELISKVAERAGIDASQAQKAIEAVLEQLQERLPEPFGSQLQSLLTGDGEGNDLADQLKGLAGGLGGLLGR
jgi:uncharacterized protein (DUF2267 family)